MEKLKEAGGGGWLGLIHKWTVEKCEGKVDN